MAMDFKDLLTMAIDASGLTVAETARRAGVAPVTVYRLLDGTHDRPQRDTLRTLGRVLNYQFVKNDTGWTGESYEPSQVNEPTAHYEPDPQITQGLLALRADLTMQKEYNITPEELIWMEGQFI